VNPEVAVQAGVVATVEKLGLKVEEVLLGVVLERCHLLTGALAAPGLAQRPVKVLEGAHLGEEIAV